jgi:hypothetical protein
MVWKCPLRAHVFKDWSPACSAVQGGGIIKRWGLVGGGRSRGA